MPSRRYNSWDLDYAALKSYTLKLESIVRASCELVEALEFISRERKNISKLKKNIAYEALAAFSKAVEK